MFNSPRLERCPLVTVLAIAAVMVFCCLPSRTAAAGADDATTRATIFQAEARKIFEKDQWSIIRKGEMSFTAVHPAAPGDANTPDATPDPKSPLLVHVSITFNPKTADSTDCVVKVEGFRLIPRQNGQKSHLEGPFKADYPANANYIRSVLETAEDRLGKKYPKYEAK